MELLTERYKNKIKGVISCYDRIIFTGTIPGICYAEGMTNYLKFRNIRIFDYPDFASRYRDIIRENAELIANANGLKIEFIRNSKSRKEDIVRKALNKEEKKTGVVYVLSAIENCPTYKPWHNKENHHTYLKGDISKCLHYYFYFYDRTYGFGYIRVPTWCPFRVQAYINGHNFLANQLRKNGIKFNLIDNAFEYVSDYDKAQEIANTINIDELKKFLEKLASKCCPVYKKFTEEYHWSTMQAEYSTDIIFKSKEQLQPIYEGLISTAIHTVKPEHIATFLGKKIHHNFQGEMGNSYNIRIEGSKIKHTMRDVSIKMYDKMGFILRIETTVNNVSFFKHYRTVEHRDRTKSQKLSNMKKTIYSLNDLLSMLYSSNKRYLNFISIIEDNHIGKANVKKLSENVIEKSRSYKGFNIFDKEDNSFLQTISRGEFLISGFRNKYLKKYLSGKSSNQISRLLKRLRLHGLIRKVGRTYKYYITTFGQLVITTCLKIRSLVLIPELNFIRS